MELLLSIFPIALLIYLMVKNNALPAFKALPLIALLVFILQWLYFGASLEKLSANVLAGIIASATPITVIFGAIFFNRMMEATGCLQTIRQWLSNINPNPIAQLMIIGWAFAFMIEGASGFGTPAAIAAPILVGLGFPPLKVAVFALVMNSVPVSFGAVGTPTWFGFASLKLKESDILEIGQQTALIHAVAALIIPLIALAFISNWREIKKNWVYVYLSIMSCVLPYFILAQFNYEFPSLVGGAIGLIASVWLANRGVGLSREYSDKGEKVARHEIMKALFPLFVLIGILVITRIHQLGIKSLLNDATPIFSLSLGIFDFEISRALILSFKNIFGQGIHENYKTLYVPALIPFVVTVWLSLLLFRSNLQKSWQVYSGTVVQILKPFLALVGALVMVKLMAVGERSMIKTIGTEFAELTKVNWIYFASYLGAIGSFFSGSNTVSNLTFGGIQQQIALETGLNTNHVLAAQSVGGAMGNMVCINNIVAVCSVLNIQNQEGAIIKKTMIPMFIYGIITAFLFALGLV